MKKFNLNQIANEIIERAIEDGLEYYDDCFDDNSRNEVIQNLKKSILEDNIDLNNDTTSYDLEELLNDEYEDEYNELQKIIHIKIDNYDLYKDWIEVDIKDFQI